MNKKLIGLFFIFGLLFILSFSFIACNLEAPRSSSAVKSLEFGNTKEEIIAFIQNHLGDNYHVAYKTTLKSLTDKGSNVYTSISVIKTKEGDFSEFMINGSTSVLSSRKSKDADINVDFDKYLILPDFSHAQLVALLAKDDFDKGSLSYIEEYAAYYAGEIILNIELTTKGSDEIFLGRDCSTYTLNDTIYLIDKETGVMLKRTDPVKDFECTILTIGGVTLPALPSVIEEEMTRKLIKQNKTDR
jgi:hypothetical protein